MRIGGKRFHFNHKYDREMLVAQKRAGTITAPARENT